MAWFTYVMQAIPESQQLQHYGLFIGQQEVDWQREIFTMGLTSGAHLVIHFAWMEKWPDL